MSYKMLLLYDVSLYVKIIIVNVKHFHFIHVKEGVTHEREKVDIPKYQSVYQSQVSR